MTVSTQENQTVRGPVTESIKQKKCSGPESRQRRRAIRKLAVGTAALAGYSLLPDKWTTPLVEFGALPVHATTSGTVAATATAAGICTSNFSLLFLETYQSCDSCGIWFDSADLVIVHSAGAFTSSQAGSLLIKQSPYRPGYFVADLSSIPCSAAIQSATLYMHLNTEEGIANSDSRSVISVYDYSTGSAGVFVRTITAAGDIKGSGYSKANPTVPIDFTAYAQMIHGQ